MICDPILVLECAVIYFVYSAGLDGIDLFHALLSLYRVEFCFVVQYCPRVLWYK